MKHRLFLPALVCCLTLAAFGFFVYALFYDSMRNTFFEAQPVLFAATWFDFICAIVFFLFAIRYRDQGIGGRLFPLWLLTILHMLLFLLSDVIPPDWTSGGDNITPGPVSMFLEAAILISPLVLFLFALVYGSVLSETNRMNRPLRTAFLLFIVNLLIQGLIAWSIWIRSRGG